MFYESSSGARAAQSIRFDSFWKMLENDHVNRADLVWSEEQRHELREALATEVADLDARVI